MPLVAAAVCPHPPMLLPEVAAGAADDLAEVRAACATAIAGLAAAEPAEIVLVGAGPTPNGAEVGRPDVPLSLAVGQWLVRRAEAAGAPDLLTTLICVNATASARECAEIGQGVAGSDKRVGLLVMGDGSICRGPKAPGYQDPRAEPFDAQVAAALADADAGGLRAIDQTLARELGCAGWAPWQVLAAAVDSAQAAEGTTAATGWTGSLLYDAAPFGVAYFVSLWLPVVAAAASSRALRS